MAFRPWIRVCLRFRGEAVTGSEGEEDFSLTLSQLSYFGFPMAGSNRRPWVY